MNESSKINGKKKGFWGTIWESMTKTGGCCGSGESCCGPVQPDAVKKPAGKKPSARTPDVTNKH